MYKSSCGYEIAKPMLSTNVFTGINVRNKCVIEVLNNAFLLRYNDAREHSFFLYFNEELHDRKKKELRAYVLQAACDANLEIEIKGNFKVRSSLKVKGELEVVYNE